MLEIDSLGKDTGYKLRVLAQNYRDTPGLAIKDFWKVDDTTIVFVADPTFDLDIPHSFWSRLAGRYGNIFYWKEKGEDISIESAVNVISTCLREPVGSNNGSEVNKYAMCKFIFVYHCYCKVSFPCVIELTLTLIYTFVA